MAKKIKKIPRLKDVQREEAKNKKRFFRAGKQEEHDIDSAKDRTRKVGLEYKESIEVRLNHPENKDFDKGADSFVAGEIYQAKPKKESRTISFRVSLEEFKLLEQEAHKQRFCESPHELCRKIVIENIDSVSPILRIIAPRLDTGVVIPVPEPCKKCEKPMTEFTIIPGRKAIWLCPHCQKKEHMAAMKKKAKNHGEKK